MCRWRADGLPRDHVEALRVRRVLYEPASGHRACLCRVLSAGVRSAVVRRVRERLGQLEPDELALRRTATTTHAARQSAMRQRQDSSLSAACRRRLPLSAVSRSQSRSVVGDSARPLDVLTTSQQTATTSPATVAVFTRHNYSSELTAAWHVVLFLQWSFLSARRQCPLWPVHTTRVYGPCP